MRLYSPDLTETFSTKEHIGLYTRLNSFFYQVAQNTISFS